jgi:hypothetical protein
MTAVEQNLWTTNAPSRSWGDTACVSFTMTAMKCA